MSYTDLGKATGLSTSAVHQRVRRLEERGVVTGYTAQVSPDALGLPLTALISVTPFDPSAPDDVPERLRHITEIEDCHSVAGEESYILKVRVGTPGDLEDLLARHPLRRPTFPSRASLARGVDCPNGSGCPGRRRCRSRA